VLVFVQYSDGAAWEDRGRDVGRGKGMDWEWGRRREGEEEEEEEGWFEAEEGEEAARARQLVERVSRNRCVPRSIISRCFPFTFWPAFSSYKPLDGHEIRVCGRQVVGL